MQKSSFRSNNQQSQSNFLWKWLDCHSLLCCTGHGAISLQASPTHAPTVWHLNLQLRLRQLLHCLLAVKRGYQVLP